MKTNWKVISLLAAFAGTVFAANWALETYGIVKVFGLSMPAGVFAAGLSFTIRDYLQREGGREWTLVGIAIGALLSLFISTKFAMASALAFAVSESADFLVYTPLVMWARSRRWKFITAVVASNIVGSVIDSALFLYLAFDSLDFIEGQIVGKLAMTVLVLPIIWWSRRAR